MGDPEISGVIGAPHRVEGNLTSLLTFLHFGIDYGAEAIESLPAFMQNFAHLVVAQILWFLVIFAAVIWQASGEKLEATPLSQRTGRAAFGHEFEVVCRFDVSTCGAAGRPQCRCCATTTSLHAYGVDIVA